MAEKFLQHAVMAVLLSLIKRFIMNVDSENEDVLDNRGKNWRQWNVWRRAVVGPVNDERQHS